MGFIKAIEGAVGNLKETYRDVIEYNKEDGNILVKAVSTETGVIQDESRLFVQPGQCAVYLDQGAIKDIITEPGMYFMDTSSPSLFQTNIFKGLGETLLESIKTIAYEGETILKQKVFFIDITEKVGLGFGTDSPIIFRDPEWGPIEIKLFGAYSIKVTNPVSLLTNVAGTIDEFRIEDIARQIRSFIVSELSVGVGNLGASFDEISSKQTELADSIIESLNKKLETFGIEVLKVVINSVDIPEEIRKSIRDRASIKMKATSVSSEEADIYTKLNTAEAIKDMANNQNSTGTSILGMNVGNAISGIVGNNTNNNNEQK